MSFGARSGSWTCFPAGVTTFLVKQKFASPLLISAFSVVVEHDPPEVWGHQLLLLISEAEAGQLQLAGTAFWQAELPVRDKGLLELVPVLQTAWYLQEMTQSFTQLPKVTSTYASYLEASFSVYVKIGIWSVVNFIAWLNIFLNVLFFSGLPFMK